MKRNFDLKRRESKNLPPEKLREILSKIYPEELVTNLMDKFFNPRGLKVSSCQGEGQGSCKRCADKGHWNKQWMCFLYKIEGYEGCYCQSCMEEILKGETDGT